MLAVPRWLFFLALGPAALAAPAPLQGELIEFQSNTPARAADVNANFAFVRTLAGSAQSSAGDALAAAMDARAAADTAHAAAGAAQASADSAQISADSAQITADSAQTAADMAQTAADLAQVAADSAQIDADAAQMDAAQAVEDSTEALAVAGEALEIVALAEDVVSLLGDGAAQGVLAYSTTTTGDDFQLSSDVGGGVMRVTSAGDAVLALTADGDDLGDAEHARIELSQDGGASVATVGFVGSEDADDSFYVRSTASAPMVLQTTSLDTDVVADAQRALRVINSATDDVFLVIAADESGDNEQGHARLRLYQDGYGMFGYVATTQANTLDLNCWDFSDEVADLRLLAEGEVIVEGTLEIQGGGVTSVDHPLDPEHKKLNHALVSSPEMLNVYSGNVWTDAAGYATVVLPDWFEAANTDFRYQLTPIGDFSRVMVSREVEHGSFEIRSEEPGVKVSWQVTGVRDDAYARTHRTEVEVLKDERERGTYMNPEAFGLPVREPERWQPAKR